MYTKIYHSHDLKRNLHKRAISTPIIKILDEQIQEITWNIVWDINYMLKVSDLEFTPHRKYELANSIYKALPKIISKFKNQIDAKPKDIEHLLAYSNEDLEVLKRNFEDNIPK